MLRTNQGLPRDIQAPSRTAGRLRPLMRRSLNRALAAILAAGLLLAGLLVVVVPPTGPTGPALLMFPLAVITYLVAGLLAWHGRPCTLMGPLILLSGAAVFLTGLGNAEVPVLVATGSVAATLPLATFVHLLLAFPAGRLPSRAAKLTAAGGYATALVLQAPSYLFSVDSGIAVANRPELVQTGLAVQAGVGAVVFLSTAALLVLRLRRASPPEHRVLMPLYAYGILAILLVLMSTRVLPRLLGWDSVLVGSFQLTVLALVPVAFALAVLRGGVARTTELEELGEWLDAATDDQAGIAAVLSRALGDPSLDVWFWVSQRQQFLNAKGEPVGQGAPDPQRAQETVELDGRLIGAVDYDRALLTEAELVRTASRVVAIALDRERLTALVHASRRELLLSRERLVEVADAERRRIAQDLHDGLQVQLVLLGIEAQQLANSAAPESALSGQALQLRHSIDRAAAELRDVVHTVMPAPLLQRGLSAATEDLVDRMPIPTRLIVSVADGELTPALESTAYFVIAEALTNSVKHSAAASVRVALERTRESLLIEVRDDGRGGAAPGLGAGLAGMAERVDVLGGTLCIHSEPGAGTSIRVEVPCA